MYRFGGMASAILLQRRFARIPEDKHLRLKKLAECQCEQADSFA
jgi:hypothetical protein